MLLRPASSQTLAAVSRKYLQGNSPFNVPTSNKCSLVFTPSQVRLVFFPLAPRGVTLIRSWVRRNVNMYHRDQHDSLLIRSFVSCSRVSGNLMRDYIKHLRDRWSRLVYLASICLCDSCTPLWLTMFDWDILVCLTVWNILVYWACSTFKYVVQCISVNGSILFRNCNVLREHKPPPTPSVLLK